LAGREGGKVKGGGGGGAMASGVPMTPELEQIDGEIQDIFRALQ
jgi:hypothetical protein